MQWVGGLGEGLKKGESRIFRPSLAMPHDRHIG
jgi:hypothetical protein